MFVFMLSVWSCGGGGGVRVVCGVCLTSMRSGVRTVALE